MNRIAGEVGPPYHWHLSGDSCTEGQGAAPCRLRQWELSVYFYSKERPEDKVNKCIRMLRALGGL